MKVKQVSDILRIRRLIWIYFWFLLMEGALRKWIIPSAANILLVARDPIVLIIYFYAWRASIFPRNALMVFGGILAFLMTTASFFALDGNLAVTLYGVHTDFLQIPFILLIPKVTDARDVDKIGFYILLCSIPIAFLMVLQFRSDSSSWLNSGVEANFVQIDSAEGHIRPPGPFSFATGPIVFYSLVAAFLWNSQFGVRKYTVWLLLSSAFSLIMATVVSGSRSLFLSVSIVSFFAIIYAIFYVVENHKIKVRWLSSTGMVVVGGLLLSRTTYFQDGVKVFSARIQNASRVEGGSTGFTDRVFSGFELLLPAASKAPALGEGLGVGTTAGAALLTGKGQFMLAEGEWERNVLESGPALGMGFIFYRFVLAFYIAIIVIRQMSRHNALPFLLFSSCFFNLIMGQLGQPTLLGFTMFTSGLCLAAMRTDNSIMHSKRRIKRMQEARLRY